MHRGQADYGAIATAVALARGGHVIAMFPEGTRRRKGLRKKWEAQSHTGAARIALEAGVPLVPAGIKGTDDLRRLAAIKVRYGTPIALDDLGSLDVAEAARLATDRLMQAIHELEELAVSKSSPNDGLLLAIDGDSLAHRAYHGIPKSVRWNAVVGFSNFLLRLWDTEHPEAVLVGLGFARDPDLPPSGAACVSVRSRVRGLDSRPTRALAAALRGLRVPDRQGGRL